MNPKDPPGPVEVRRSRNRLRTVTAYRDGDRVVVAIPARFTGAQEREWVRRMVARLADQERRRRPSDEELATRALELSTRYLAGQAIPASVNWSTNQGRRWGSCTPADGTIRISTRVRGMPRWVIDYVLLHELAHLLHIGHGPEFWATLEDYPRTERARGFLEGVTFGEERVARGDPELGAGQLGSPELEPATAGSVDGNAVELSEAVDLASDEVDDALPVQL
ncbi:M48 family metallopeptidase [Pengzhenrongella sicca]|uniref:M48 family metallopeptidase n=1 Tax=Pengzhenrongella sicca TaxID=2819238 RepID=A0A8A4ZF36_9MICO|nr:M48 family metallopeptidase [Pengzhenrongella sicca]QTE30021.1 M48 family metallopeptidase [Pengzhenrongella sicca]